MENRLLQRNVLGDKLPYIVSELRLAAVFLSCGMVKRKRQSCLGQVHSLRKVMDDG